MFQSKNQINRNRFITILTLGAAVTLVSASIMRAQATAGPRDILYISDGGGDNKDTPSHPNLNNTVKRFDADTGAFLGTLVSPGSAGLLGPRGIIIDPFLGGNFIVVNQNVNRSFAGEILEYSATDGQFIAALVPCNNPLQRPCETGAPFAPRGIVRGQSGNFFVAQLGEGTTGSVGQFDGTGAFLGNLDFAEFNGDSFGEYHPRSVVFGPDGMLYVSVVGNLDPKDRHFDQQAGFILRFRSGRLFDVFASNSNASCPSLHRPEGLTFGPDGKLYVTSFRANPSDTDKIVVLQADGTCPRNNIDLDNADDIARDPKLRAFAQALLFGPGGDLFVPINNTGEVRRYNVQNKKYSSFVPANGPLLEPWYLTFGKTDPSTLQYH